MTINLLNISKFSAFFAVAALAVTPATADTGGKEYRCGALAQQASAAADSADESKQRVAKRFVAIGDKLCAAGNGRDAAKQYRSALRAAGATKAASAE